MKEQYGDITVTRVEDHIIQCEIHRAPNNFFDIPLIQDLGTCFDDADEDPSVRAIVLCSEGKHFCAGANFGAPRDGVARPKRTIDSGNPLYNEAVRLFGNKKPVVAAVQGAAVGGGFGLAMMADFRVLCPSTRMTANFVKLGFSPGFGLTHTLPRAIGIQKTNLMFLTGRRVDGKTAYEWGMGEVFTDDDNLRNAAIELAREVAENAPLALVSIREQMRPGLKDGVKAATDMEGREQFLLQQTEDHKEGVKAVAERRVGNFKGK